MPDRFTTGSFRAFFGLLVLGWGAFGVFSKFANSSSSLKKLKLVSLKIFCPT